MKSVIGGASDCATIEQQRLALALAVSILLHAYVLFCIRHPPPLRSTMESQRVLEVSFRGASRAVVPTLQQEELKAMLAIASVVNKPVRQIKPNKPLAAAHEKTARARDAAPKTHRVAPGTASVIIVIDENGRPRDLIWNVLPALTQEQFDLLERRVRQRVYPNVRAGTAIDETIDVMTLTRQEGAQ